MRKKLVSLLLVTAMSVTALAGCGSKADGTEGSKKEDKKEAQSITFMAPDWAVPTDEQLDEFTKEKLHMDLLDIWSKTNKTIIFVTHNIQEAVLLSDRIGVLSPHPGRLSAVIDVDIDRPRRLEDRDTMHFAELVSKVRNSFEGGSL